MLSHLIGAAQLAPYSEVILPTGKKVKTIQPTLDKVDKLSVEQASYLIGLFAKWRKSNEENDLALVKYALNKEFQINRIKI